MEEQESLSKKERIAAKKAEKEARRAAEAKSASRKKWIALSAVILVIVGIIVAVVLTRETVSTLSNQSPDPFLGNPDAEVTLTAYEDYQCPACAAAAPVIKNIMEEYGDRVKFVYNDFPLPQHRNGSVAAVGAECVFQVAGNDSFFDYHDTLFQEQSSWSLLGENDAEERFRQFAVDQGDIDMAAFDACVSGTDGSDKVNEDLAEGRGLGVRSTPSFFVNDQRISESPFSLSIPRALDEALGEN